MSNQKRFIAKNGLDNNNQTITNVLDPVNLQDAVTLNFGRNASNLATGTVDQARLPDLSGTYQPTSASLTNISNLSGTSGFLVKTGTNTWTLDTNSYVNKAGDTMTGILTLSSNPSNPLEAATKAYVDNFVSGIIWDAPILDPNLKDDSLTAPPVPVSNEVYIIGASATGVWAGLDGHAVFWNGSTWVDLLGRAVAPGDRFGVLLEYNTQTPAGGLSTKLNNIAQVDTATPGSITYTFSPPTNNIAVFVSGSNLSHHFGHSYVYTTASAKWTEFNGPTVLIAGNGISYTSNILSVVTASSSRIAVGPSGVDLASGVVTPGTYYISTVDTYGRVTAGSKVITPIALTDGATVAWDWSTAPSATLTIGGNRTLSNPTNAINGQYCVLRVTRTGTFGLSFDTLYKGVSGITQTTVNNGVDHYVFRYNGTNFELVGFRSNVGA